MIEKIGFFLLFYENPYIWICASKDRIGINRPVGTWKEFAINNKIYFNLFSTHQTDGSVKLRYDA